MIARDFLAHIEDWDRAKALGVFTRLLRQERGAYWTFLVFTGDRYLVGASPERHVRVQAGEVSMNPISGTFRLGDAPAGASGDLAERLLRFLGDEKEIFELFMVVDEELKMMCGMCSGGGSITGPFLKPMSHLIHTEYLLNGRSSLDVRDVLRDSMFAATVTGSPVENACRLITTYEAGRPRLLRRRARSGRSRRRRRRRPWTPRSCCVRPMSPSTGGSGSPPAPPWCGTRDPRSEVAETHAKAAGILSAFGLVPLAASASDRGRHASSTTPSWPRRWPVGTSQLSRFWLADQSGAAPSSELSGRHVVVLDGEDDFVAMLRHMLRVLGHVECRRSATATTGRETSTPPIW